MSANNWTLCPKCGWTGKESLREDYELFLNRKTLSIKYKCKCMACGFIYRYEKEIKDITREGY